MTLLSDLLEKGRPVETSCGWPRSVVDTEAWTEAAALAGSGDVAMSGFWSDGGFVHLALLDEREHGSAIVSLACVDGCFPSVAAIHPPAIRMERSIRDLYGLCGTGTPDDRPWLDHGRWGVTFAGGERQGGPDNPLPYRFRGADGAPLHQIPVGPVHAGIIEPGHFRFTAHGETVVRLEERLGYVHKGIERLLGGKPLAQAARIAARVSGDSTVAFSFGFALAAERALDVAVPPRAQAIRAIMAELERLANHLGDVGAICNDAAFSLIHAHCHILRERVLRTSFDCFGHRLMMDRIVPGGVQCDLDDAGIGRLRALAGEIEGSFPHIVSVYASSSSIQDRTTGTGVLSRNLVEQYACGGVIGRASGRAFDARHWPGYAPYGALSVTPAHRTAGDVDARVLVRIDEIDCSLALIASLLDSLPDGPVVADIRPPTAVREGTSLVEGFRGDVLTWLRLSADGTVDHCHLRDPSWFQWPLLEAAIEGNIVADFPLCNKSFNCSYSGHDL